MSALLLVPLVASLASRIPGAAAQGTNAVCNNGFDWVSSSLSLLPDVTSTPVSRCPIPRVRARVSSLPGSSLHAHLQLVCLRFLPRFSASSCLALMPRFLGLSAISWVPLQHALEQPPERDTLSLQHRPFLGHCCLCNLSRSGRLHCAVRVPFTSPSTLRDPYLPGRWSTYSQNCSTV